ncbi:MAG: phage holin family protein [Gammaproteobacteria bacterium]|nr:phage holin family protein [Gammaproteobacteria bacterium]
MSSSPVDAQNNPSTAWPHFLAGFLGLVRTRIELFSVELQEEKIRAHQTLLLLVIAVVFLGITVLLITIFVLALFWDTYRLWAIISMTLIYASIGLLALWIMRCQWQNSPRAFAMTMGEFEKDITMFAARAQDSVDE